MRITVAVSMLALPMPAVAQVAETTAPVIGLAVGVARLPQPLVNDCGDNSATLPAFELRGGLTRAAWRGEIRAAIANALVSADCSPVVTAHENGTFTDPIYPYERRTNGSAISAHVQFDRAHNLWTISAGVGAHLPSKVPFAVGTMAFRTRGDFALFAELQGYLSRLRRELVTAEWVQYQVSKVLQRHREYEWARTLGARVGIEVRL